jgi:hypothetical protein
LLDDTSRSASDCFLCDRTDLRESKAVFPQRRTVFDFFPVLTRAAWERWADGAAPVCDSPIDRQFVPTAESVPALFLTSLLSAAYTRKLLVGRETLKTLLFHVLGDDAIDLSVFVARRVVLSHSSQPRNLSGYILSVTNRRHGHVGPLLVRPSLMLLDDLVAAQREKYSGQPILELLR